MTKYITTNSDGGITGMYDDAVRPPPTDAQKISDADFKLLGPGKGYLNGAVIDYTAAPIPLTLEQQAAVALAAGLTITSAGTPALNGTYAVASGVPFGREDIGTEAQFISTFQEFTNGTQTLEWPLIDGKTFVTFPNTETFMNFAKAAAQYYAAVKGVAALGTGTLPSATVKIS